MSTEHTYFVGRRVLGGAEVYAVTATDVERLRVRRGHSEPALRGQSEPALDWRESTAAALELSRLMIGRVVQRRTPRELHSRFALYVVAQLPHRGFVISSEEIWRWLRLAGDVDASVRPPRASLATRLRTRLLKTTTHVADV
jgi:hypothetical protein